MSTPPIPQGAFSLFPNTSSPPNRPRASSRATESGRSTTPSGEHRIPMSAASPPRQTPRSPPRIDSTATTTKKPRPPVLAIDTSVGSSSRSAPAPAPAPPPPALPVQQPRAAADAPPRVDTAFSEAPTLVHVPSVRRRSLDVQRPLNTQQSHHHHASLDRIQALNNTHHSDRTQPNIHHSRSDRSQPQHTSDGIAAPSDPHPPYVPQQPLRSMFPQYNPDLPATQQQYFPTQPNTTHNIPRHIVSRASVVHPTPNTLPPINTTNAPPADASDPAPPSAASSRWRRRINNDERLPPPPAIDSVDALKGLWKTANGWRASQSEGRVYRLAMSQEKDAPSYLLSAADGKPFYNLRLDPTSTSAKVALLRHDPAKPYRSSTTAGASSSANPSTAPDPSRKHWLEALGTVLEEPARHHAPQDGLVALLYPTAACKAALARPEDTSTVALAERECARLVWDDDSESHFLVHPALATPFCVAVERTPSWSRVAYTLEHPESPQHLARLTRDGTGGGWLEIDTGLAAHVDAYYIVDVAISALMIVAAADESFRAMETFEPPPPSTLAFPPPAALVGGPTSPVFFSPGGDDGAPTRRSRRFFNLRSLRRSGSFDKNTRSRDGRKMEQFQIGVEEAPTSSGENSLFPNFEKKKTRSRLRSKSSGETDGWPIWARCVYGSVRMVGKLVLWVLEMIFRAIARCFREKK